MTSDARPTPPDALQPTLDTLRAAWQARRPDAAQRRDDLARLRAALQRRLDEMATAIAADFGHRSRQESLIADGMSVLTEIDRLRRSLRGWMQPRRIGAGLKLWPARAQLRPVPLGVVGVIAPWNYPVNLALIPLATAIAAGNHVYLKPSEHTPRTSAFLVSLLAEVFPPDRVAVACGDSDIGAAFAGLPFDHLVFTGSTAVGRKVMAAAAAHLTPLTLELGGKSPAIVCPGHPLDKAAARLVTGKLFNAGQTCIAPDYVLLPRGSETAFGEAFARAVATLFPTIIGNPDYAAIISPRHLERLQALLAQAEGEGARLQAVQPDTAGMAGVAAASRQMAPVLVFDLPAGSKLLSEEIFGPILPVIPYTAIDEAIRYVNARPRPLALYWFGTDTGSRDHVLARTVSGGVTVNDTLMHIAHENLPFGGVGDSGWGAYHGETGFLRLSQQKPVMLQSKWARGDLFYPPYGKRFEQVMGLLKRLI